MFAVIIDLLSRPAPLQAGFRYEYRPAKAQETVLFKRKIVTVQRLGLVRPGVR